MSFTAHGAEIIQQRIDSAAREGVNQITVSGDYEIESTILIPSNFTLILENCHLWMADSTFCNMFANASCRTEKGRADEGADHDIIIRGIGRAILDGGEYNGLSERNSLKDGRPHISVNNILLFANVDGFRVENLHVRNQRWWALNFIYCRNGYIGGIDFLADYTAVYEDGKRYPGLGKRRYEGDCPASYEQVYIKNADGIDLRAGCHDIIIENITGFTEDDTVALTGLAGRLEEMFCVKGRDMDIYNIVIRNVMSSAYCANVRLLNQGGIRLFNILVDGVMDSSMNSPYMERGGSGVRLGDTHLYGKRHAAADETFNITIRNVCSRASAALRIAGAMKDCLFENIRLFDNDGSNALLVNDATVDITPYLKLNSN